jgi:hypothetical protein
MKKSSLYFSKNYLQEKQFLRVPPIAPIWRRPTTCRGFTNMHLHHVEIFGKFPLAILLKIVKVFIP